MKFSCGIVPAVAAVLLISGCAATETATTTKPQHIDAGQQQGEVIIASSSFYEACERLSPGQQVEYSFVISKPVDFFTAEAKAIYCCMWSNKQAVPVSLTYDFKIIED